MTYSPTSLPRNPDWRDDAECRRADRNIDPELFHPAGTTGHWLVQIEDAKAVCRACPVMRECRQWAMDRPEESGIWGGMTEHERANWRRRMRRAAQAPAPARTLADVYATSIKEATDGHLIWTGSANTSINGVQYSPNRLAWAATRDTEPVGVVTRYCDVQGCVAHLEDQPARTARLDAARPDPADLGPDSKCGTRWGYELHLKRGEPTCAYCRAAHAASKRQPAAAV